MRETYAGAVLTRFACKARRVLWRSEIAVTFRYPCLFEVGGIMPKGRRSNTGPLFGQKCPKYDNAPRGLGLWPVVLEKLAHSALGHYR